MAMSSVLQSAERMKGLSGGHLARLKAMDAKISAEKDLIGTVEEALRDGGWSNAGAEPGDYESYQPLESIEVDTLTKLRAEHSAYFWITQRGTHSLSPRRLLWRVDRWTER
jgi:hypothetical protein